MKRTIAFLWVLFALPFVVRAQNDIPNASFEEWATGANGMDSLIGWSSSNTVAIHPVIPLKKDPDHAYQGKYSGLLITAPFGIVGYSKIGMLVNGNASFTWTGGMAGYGVTLASGGGTPINFKPTALKGFFRYEALVTNVNGWVQVLLTKYNTAQQKRDTVSYGTTNFFPDTTFTEFTVNLPDQMPGVTPDSITIIFYSAQPDLTPDKGAWTSLNIDSLSLDKPAMLQPIADFVADSTDVTVQSIVHLYDSSLNHPTAWHWELTPATFDYKNGTTDTSQNPIVQFNVAGDYTVTLAASNADGSDTLTKMDYIHVAAPGRIVALPQMKGKLLYPNPAQDMLYLNPGCIGGVFKVVDLSGRTLMKQQPVHSLQVDIHTLPDGIYFFQYTKGGQTLSDKFEVMRP